MKKSMVLFALATIAATGANATKARLNALGGSNWVPVEYQDIFTSPHKMMLLENQAQVEMGPASTFTTATGPSIGSPSVRWIRHWTWRWKSWLPRWSPKY